MNLQEIFCALGGRVEAAVLGQEALVERLLIALLADGRLLLEGAPGLAKTRTIKVLSELIEGSFHRLQFTPDLLPADLTGTEIFRPQQNDFHFIHGPLFHEFLLVDEINRAPAKVQSALLEAMAERQISVGQTTFDLPRLFMVMATQNPIEHEGTYQLPEAQLDRFMLHVRVDYPDRETEQQILRLNREEARAAVTTGSETTTQAIATREQVFAARGEVLDLYLSPELERYIVELVAATRDPGSVDEGLAGSIRFGASPRATIALARCSQARAWLSGRDYVSPADIQAIAPDVLRHRLLLSYEAEAMGLTPDHLVEKLLQRLVVP